MTLNTLDTEGSHVNGPWILACGHCNWTSLDIGIQFDKATNIFSQLFNKKNGGTQITPAKAAPEDPETPPNALSIDKDPHAVFGSLKSFLSSQLSTSTPLNPLLTPSGDYNYNSPSSLARIMSLYTGLGAYNKKTASKSTPMRQSADLSEGLQVTETGFDATAIQKLRTEGWSSTTSISQLAEQRHPKRFVDDIRPQATLLRTKRSKRCRTCRHILVKPEAKVQSTRFRIRLVALNYIPTISLKALKSPFSSSQPSIDLNALPILRASQFLLTLKNPMFDAVKITLATPGHTPGRYSHKITILCPQFDIGANTDAWDEALSGGEGKRSSKLHTSSKSKTDTASGEGKVAEAGKVWDIGRNWATVVVEVVCATVEEAGEEDEDVLEIPVFVRMEWEGEVAGEESGTENERREKRELAYWAVIGVGRVERLEE